MSSAIRPASQSRAARAQPAAAAARRPAVTRARGRSGRLRLIAIAGFLAVLVFGAVHAISPMFQRAIRQLSLPLQYSVVIKQQASAKKVDPALVAAVIYAETGFDARTSSAGAMGLMQVEPETAELLARQSGATNFHVSDLSTPTVNIAYGTYYLKELLREFNGDEIAALAAYNGGETNVDRWISRAHQSGHAFGVSDIPFPATHAYVQKVMQAQTQYREKYPVRLGYE